MAICSIALLILGETCHLKGRDMVTVWRTVLLLSGYNCDSTHQHYDVTQFEYALWRHTMHEWVMNIHYKTWIAQGRFTNMILTPSKQWGVCDNHNNSTNIVTGQVPAMITTINCMVNPHPSTDFNKLCMKPPWRNMWNWPAKNQKGSFNWSTKWSLFRKRHFQMHFRECVCAGWINIGVCTIILFDSVRLLYCTASTVVISLIVPTPNSIDPNVLAIAIIPPNHKPATEYNFSI